MGRRVLPRRRRRRPCRRGRWSGEKWAQVTRTCCGNSSSGIGWGHRFGSGEPAELAVPASLILQRAFRLDQTKLPTSRKSGEKWGTPDHILFTTKHLPAVCRLKDSARASGVLFHRSCRSRGRWRSTRSLSSCRCALTPAMMSGPERHAGLA